MNLTPEQLQEQAAIAARLAALGLPILTAEKSNEYRDAINARRLAVVERWTGQKWIEVRLRWNGTEYKENN